MTGNKDFTDIIINRHILRRHCLTLNYNTEATIHLLRLFSNICITGFELYVFRCKFKRYYLIFLLLEQLWVRT